MSEHEISQVAVLVPARMVDIWEGSLAQISQLQAAV